MSATQYKFISVAMSCHVQSTNYTAVILFPLTQIIIIIITLFRYIRIRSLPNNLPFNLKVNFLVFQAPYILTKLSGISVAFTHVPLEMNAIEIALILE